MSGNRAKNERGSRGPRYQKLSVKHARLCPGELEEIVQRIQPRLADFQKDHHDLRGHVLEPTSHYRYVDLVLWIIFNEAVHRDRAWLPSDQGSLLWPLRQREMDLMGNAAAAVMDEDMVIEKISYDWGNVSYSFLPARCAFTIEEP